ncbi:MAG: hypothetical protein LBS27_01240 [Bifidobacteriaceae bacterium]|jgi:hypothetical protein|nr:hypothetical protein [Bifidobacteriaceae bacterium]
MKLSLRTSTACAAVAAAAALALAGCAAEQPSGTGSPSGSPSPQGAESAAREPVNPLLTGTIAAVADELLQVQDSEKQTAVAYSADTVITAQVAGSAADVAVGVCVVASGEAPAGEDGAADGAAQAEAVFAATTVAVTAAEADGTCSSAGLRGGGLAGGGFPGGSTGELPDGLPSGGPSGQARGGAEGGPGGGRPSGAPSGGEGFPGEGEGGEGFPPGGSIMGSVAAGLVTAVEAGTVTVEQSWAAGGPDGGGAAGADGETDGTAGGSESLTRSFTMAEAEITTTKPADSSVLQVGKCVVVQGDSDSSGQVSAETLAVSEPGDSGCQTAAGAGFGNRTGRPDGGAQGTDSTDGADYPGGPRGATADEATGLAASWEPSGSGSGSREGLPGELSSCSGGSGGEATGDQRTEDKDAPAGQSAGVGGAEEGDLI